MGCASLKGVNFSMNVSSRLTSSWSSAQSHPERYPAGDILPLRRTWAPDLRFGEPPRVEHVLFERRALRAQSSAIGGMIGIAFDVDHLRE